ncbi:MAG: hypothetical protein SP1CHLAM54_08880 [Chlamydiia bacterium]|nr:hypothetical protein [Chlamydiia bacterium]MCH9615794.1 hypothetical protein [Chlamydiia bacterium]MCH9628803.1 hypothetical protein [Chlamydiia bacterium]
MLLTMAAPTVSTSPPDPLVLYEKARAEYDAFAKQQRTKPGSHVDKIIFLKQSAESRAYVQAAQALWDRHNKSPQSVTGLPRRCLVLPNFKDLGDASFLVTSVTFLRESPELFHLVQKDMRTRLEMSAELASNFLNTYLNTELPHMDEVIDMALSCLQQDEYENIGYKVQQGVDLKVAINTVTSYPRIYLDSTYSPTGKLKGDMFFYAAGRQHKKTLFNLYQLFDLVTPEHLKTIVLRMHKDARTLLYEEIYKVDGSRGPWQFGETEFNKSPKGPLTEKALFALADAYLS